MTSPIMMYLKAAHIEGADCFTEDWHFIDCGVNTAPGHAGHSLAYRIACQHPEGIPIIYGENTEIYIVRNRVWKRAGNPDGCLCIGCLEQRLGHQLRPGLSSG